MNMIQVAVTPDLADAEEMKSILLSAGIESELRPAVEQHPSALGDVPTQVLVDEANLAAAQDAIEALTEPDDLISRALARPAAEAVRPSGHILRSTPLTRSREAGKECVSGPARSIRKDAARRGRPLADARANRPRDRRAKRRPVARRPRRHPHARRPARPAAAAADRRVRRHRGRARDARHHVPPRRRRTSATARRPIHPQPVVRATSLDFPLEGMTCVLVDDVLYTGRTIRAAIEALFAYGRPARVQLACLVDRGPPRASDPTRLRRQEPPDRPRRAHPGAARRGGRGRCRDPLRNRREGRWLRSTRSPATSSCRPKPPERRHLISIADLDARRRRAAAHARPRVRRARSSAR